MIRTEQGYAQIFKIYGKSETEVKEKLQDLLKCGGAVVIYTRRRGKDVHVLAETQAEDEESAKAALKPVAKEIKKALGDMYYSTKENETMEETVVRLLTKYGLTVTTAAWWLQRSSTCQVRLTYLIRVISHIRTNQRERSSMSARQL